MENFIIESDNKKILVNNVELDLLFDDAEFVEKMIPLSDEIKEYTKNKQINKVEGICKSVDDLLGNGTCEKVFGCKKPAIWRLEPFLTYLNNYIEEFSNKRMSKIKEKYGAERLGEEDV